MKIAVIGGGVGGLAVAFNLIKSWPSSKGPLPSVTVYEKSSRFGGNGDTVTFSLGYDMHISPIRPATTAGPISGSTTSTRRPM